MEVPGVLGAPGAIRRLAECVVNRIAAGEIIQRPSNALKELVENSLDAKSTNIMVTVKAGGLKYLQIQDNGTGIRNEDLQIVCERFTTSKLHKYEDLREMSTYGFRGEALASISHIAHLAILTKTAADKCAYKASYEDGKLIGPVKACAGNNGTQITVEDLFYNVTTRKKALRSPSEEYALIQDVVGSYAIHNSRVGFTLKKFGEKTDIKTAANSSVIENVRVIYGNAIARELMALELADEGLRLALRGYVTNVNYSHKKGTLLLFINHRLVDSVSIRKAIDSVYATYLPKNAHSFVYLSLELDPRNVDVNVHPTKHEVHFLHEEQIIEKIKSCLEAKLLSCNSTRVMYTQARLPGATMVEEEPKKQKEGAKVYAHNLVRTSYDSQKMDKFFPIIDKPVGENVERLRVNDEIQDECNATPDHNEETQRNISLGSSEQPENIPDDEPDIAKETYKTTLTSMGADSVTYVDPKESFKTRTFQYARVETKLTSIKQLRMEVEANLNSNLREIMANLIFIGCIDVHRSLIQHSTRLYLCDTTKVTEELFYETLLYDFQNLGIIRLSVPLPLDELFLLALDAHDSGWTPEVGEKKELAGQMCAALAGKRAMLNEYFSLEISEDGKLHALPLLLDGHTPYMGALPTYLTRLVTEVNWDSEKPFFETFCRQTAAFYSQPDPDPRPEAGKTEQWKQEHIVYPAVRKFFLPPRSFVTNGAMLQVTNLSDLYKVFERC